MKFLTRLAASLATRQRYSTFLNSTSASYVESMYEAWKKDKGSVHLSWQLYFDNPNNAISTPPTILPSNLPPPQEFHHSQEAPGEIKDHMKVQLLVRAYQVYSITLISDSRPRNSRLGSSWNHKSPCSS